jgi:hypothetical protein
VVVALDMVNVALVVAEQLQAERAVVARHNRPVEQVRVLETDTQVLAVLHIKVEIQKMKAAAVVVVSTAAVAVAITPVAVADRVTSLYSLMELQLQVATAEQQQRCLESTM